MADKPILFSGPMVCALLEGRKTQTRRVIRNVMQNNCITLKNSTKTKAGLETHVIDAPEHPRLLPVKVTKGDRLWVRETWRPRHGFGAWDMRLRYPADDYEALLEDGDRDIGDWTWPKAANTGNVPAIHMPRWASRITLKVTNVRVERLQKISVKDALAEGMTFPHGMAYGCDPQDAFRTLWDSLNKDRGFGWDANPWVAAYTFEVVKQNIDQMKAAA